MVWQTSEPVAAFPLVERCVPHLCAEAEKCRSSDQIIPISQGNYLGRVLISHLCLRFSGIPLGSDILQTAFQNAWTLPKGLAPTGWERGNYWVGKGKEGLNTWG